MTISSTIDIVDHPRRGVWPTLFATLESICRLRIFGLIGATQPLVIHLQTPNSELHQLAWHVPA